MKAVLDVARVSILSGLAIEVRTADGEIRPFDVQSIRPTGRALLIGLVLGGPAGLSVDQAKLWAWPADAQPADSQPVSTQMSLLRKLGFPISSARGADTYRLKLAGPCTVDAVAFTELAKDGREAVDDDPVAAVAAWECALELWPHERPLADLHPYVHRSQALFQLERAYTEVVAGLADALLRRPVATSTPADDARVAELIARLADLSDDARLPGLNQALTLRQRGRTIPPPEPAATAYQGSYVTQYVRRCSVVDPRHLRRSHLTQDVVLPLADVYLALTVELNRADPPETAASEPALPADDTIAELPGSAEISFAGLVREHRWIVMLGAPGAGKSTLLQWLALMHANALREGEDRVVVEGRHLGSAEPEVDLGPARLPILVRVAQYAEYLATGTPDPSVLDFLARHRLMDEPLTGEPEERAALIRTHLRAGTALVLLDGLDELTDTPTKVRVRHDIERFVGEHIVDPTSPDALALFGERTAIPWWQAQRSFPAESGGNQIVVTSRIHGYQEAALDGRYTLVRIRPLTRALTQRFCSNWCLAVRRFRAQTTGATDDEIRLRGAEDAHALVRAIESSPGVAQLATNPLLLTVLAMLMRERSALPAQRIGVYHEAAQVLVERRASGWSMEQVLDLLGPLALWLHEHRSDGVATLEEVRRHVSEAMYRRVLDVEGGDEVERFIDAARNDTGILVEVAPDRFSFAHLTFQEFFAAKELTRSLRTFGPALTARLHDPRWAEVLLLAVAAMSQTHPDDIEGLLTDVLDAGSEHEDLLHRDLLFVASCLAEMPRVVPSVLRTVLDRLFRAGADARRDGYRELNDRTIAVLSRLYAVARGMVLPNLIEALRDQETSELAADVVEAAGAASLDLLDALEEVCARWNRPPRAVAVRARVARRLRISGTAIDPVYRPISTLLNVDHPEAAAWYRQRVPALQKLFYVINDRVDPAVYEHIRWLLAGWSPDAPPDPDGIVDRLVERLIDACGTLRGSDLSAIAGVAYQLAPFRFPGWLHSAYTKGDVDTWSAARLFADLPVLVPAPPGLDGWSAGLSDDAAVALMRQSPTLPLHPGLARLAWSNLDRGGPVGAAALRLLKRGAAHAPLEVTTAGVVALGNVVGTIDDGDLLPLLTRLSLPDPAPADLIAALESLGRDGHDLRRTPAVLLLATVPGRIVDEHVYDQLAEALLRDGERWRVYAAAALRMRRTADTVTDGALRRARSHWRTLRTADPATADVHTGLAHGLSQMAIERFSALPGAWDDDEAPTPAIAVTDELLDGLPGLPAPAVREIVGGLAYEAQTGKPTGIDLTRLLQLAGHTGFHREIRQWLFEMFGTDAARTGRADTLLDVVQHASEQDTDLCAAAVRGYALWASSNAASVGAIPDIRAAAAGVLRKAHAVEPVPMIGALTALDVVELAGPNQALELLRTRSSTVRVAAGALLWALSSTSRWMSPQTAHGRPWHQAMLGLVGKLADQERGLRAVVQEIAAILSGQDAGWNRQRAALAAAELLQTSQPDRFGRAAAAIALPDLLEPAMHQAGSYNVRLLSRTMAGRLRVNDPNWMPALLSECRDSDAACDSALRWTRAAPQPSPVDPDVAIAAMTGPHWRTAWLAANLVVQNVNALPPADVQRRQQLLGAIVTALRSGSPALDLARPAGSASLRSAVYALVDGVAPTPAPSGRQEIGLHQLASDATMLGRHRQMTSAFVFGGTHSDAIQAATATLATVVARRRMMVLRDPDDRPQRVNPPKPRGGPPVSWTAYGLADLTDEETRLVAQAIYDLCERRTGDRLVKKFSAKDIAEFDAFVERDGIGDALAWLERKTPNYRLMTLNVLTELQREARSSAAEILAGLRSS
ncbi:DUF5663 domain-containing protein [Dactylosporangium sp. CS-047395]|uniref:DUF5663 domain-containing protein n=1 Tax=Dactylosporangium sp. CS-047395 TaxID=3239936 RepID=UPI003D912F0E